MKFCTQPSFIILFGLTGQFFVRDGIHSVADYNSTRMGVVLVVVVVLVV